MPESFVFYPAKPEMSETMPFGAPMRAMPPMQPMQKGAAGARNVWIGR